MVYEDLKEGMVVSHKVGRRVIAVIKKVAPVNRDRYFIGRYLLKDGSFATENFYANEVKI